MNDAAGGGRREPVVGDLRGLRFEPRAARQPRGASARRHRGWLVAVLLVLAALVAAAVVWHEPLADRMWPQARARALSEQAAQALARGHLVAADGSGARELYEAAVAIDPDLVEPRAGLARVADAALAQAGVALREGRFADAHARLRLARELSAPRARVDAIAGRLRTREAALAGLDAVMARADAARAEGRLEGEDAALPLYARVLALQPDRADALRGREDALGALLEQARSDLRSGDVRAAAAAIATARRYDAGHVDLPDTQARLNEELDDLRGGIEASLRRGRTQEAVASSRRLLEYDPADATALAGLQRAAQVHATRGRQLAADFRFAEAGDALREVGALAPGSTHEATVRAAIQRARQRQAQLQASTRGYGSAASVPGLLREAADAEARGDLLSPPGESAYDKLRAAQAIAPRDAAVRRAVARLLPSARTCFERGLSANDLGLASRCLAARESLGEAPANLAQARRQLAAQWLAIGAERLGAGKLEAANAALASAATLDPAVPGIGEFRDRLRAASRKD